MIKADTSIVEKLCQRVGAFMIEQSQRFEDNDIEYKSNQSLVSYVDKSSELMLIDGLLPLFPQAGFLVEEKSVSYDPSKEIIWIIDPLDGTTNYLHHLPFYCISIALQVRGELAQGFIYHVSTGNFYSATKGEGAFLNGKSISVAQTEKISLGVFATGFPHGLSINLDFYFDIFKEQKPTGVLSTLYELGLVVFYSTYDGHEETRKKCKLLDTVYCPACKVKHPRNDDHFAESIVESTTRYAYCKATSGTVMTGSHLIH